MQQRFDVMKIYTMVWMMMMMMIMTMDNTDDDHHNDDDSLHSLTDGVEGG